MRKFKTVFMRGGTSKGCMFHKEDLPEDRKEWDNIFTVHGRPGSKADRRSWRYCIFQQ